MWYRFTASSNVTFTADTLDSTYDTILSVYTGACGTLAPVPGACNDDVPSGLMQSRVSFPTVAGTTYYFMISAFNSDGGTLVFRLNAVTRPPNDSCAAATALTTLPFTTTLSTTGATTDMSDPLQSCTFGGAGQNTNSVWYRFTAPSNGTVTANTAGSDYDTVLAAYTGSCGALSEVTCNDDVGFPTVTSQVTFPVTVGTTYLLEPTHSFLAPAGGMLHFALTFTTTTPTASPTVARTNTPTSIPIATPTRTPTSTPTAVTALPGDGNCDNRVTAADLTAIVMVFGHKTDPSCPRADFNQNGVVDATDLAAAIQLEFVVFEQ